jgi:hypothetical protein
MSENARQLFAQVVAEPFVGVEIEDPVGSSRSEG